LSGANLSEAKLNRSIIIDLAGNQNLLNCEGADFDDAIIDDKKLLSYLDDHNASSLPFLITDGNQLKNNLRNRGLNVEGIDYLLSYT
jgi:uncharacterized protein YjbI with pentapeptide repeats